MKTHGTVPPLAVIASILFLAAMYVLANIPMDIKKPSPPPPLLAGTVYVPKLPEPMPFPDLGAFPATAIPPMPTIELPPAWVPEPAVNCIAIAVFAESRGESALGQALVAATVVNRARSLSIDECSVISASGQYHATLSADPWLIDAAAWRRSLDIAQIVRNDEYDMASCAGVTHFHHNDVNPHWSSTLNYACKVGDHTYYRMPQ